MKLTRRDAAAALAALGVAGGAALGVREWRRGAGVADAPDGDDAGDGDDAPDGDDPALADDRQVRDAVVAVARVVYPSELDGVEQFVERILDARLEREGHGQGLRRAVAELDARAEEWQGAPVAELDRGTRERHLREVGVDGADEDPDGTLAQRVRYYVVNELLLALYSSPTGGELVGIENPQGHPGGLDTYQRGPSGE